MGEGEGSADAVGGEVHGGVGGVWEEGDELGQ